MEKIAFYEKGMESLRRHHEEICFRVMKSRNEDRGNFAYLLDDDIKREEELGKWLQFAMWQLYCDMNDIQSNDYCTGELKCRDCTSKRFRFHSERAPDHWCNEGNEEWYCQAECECK